MLLLDVEVEEAEAEDSVEVDSTVDEDSWVVVSCVVDSSVVEVGSSVVVGLSSVVVVFSSVVVGSSCVVSSVFCVSDFVSVVLSSSEDSVSCRRTHCCHRFTNGPFPHGSCCTFCASRGASWPWFMADGAS